MYFCDLYQFNGIKNHQNKLLDLVFANVNESSVSVIEDVNPVSLPVDAYHPPLEISIAIDSLTYIEEIQVEKLNFYKANYDVINNRLAECNWNSLLKGNVNEMTRKFYNVLYAVIDEFVPKKMARKKDYPIFFSFQLIKLLEDKEYYRQRWKRHKQQIDYSIYSNLRKECKARIVLDEANYIASIETNISRVPKFFWQYTKELRLTNSYPTSMKFHNHSSSDPAEISNMFASYFESVYKTPSVQRPTQIPINGQPQLFQMSFTINEVFELINGLNANKGAGPDDLPNEELFDESS